MDAAADAVLVLAADAALVVASLELLVDGAVDGAVDAAADEAAADGADGVAAREACRRRLDGVAAVAAVAVSKESRGSSVPPVKAAHAVLSWPSLYTASPARDLSAQKLNVEAAIGSCTGRVPKR